MIFELLTSKPHYAVSERIEIAKGKNELTIKVSKIKEQFKRNKLWQMKQKKE